MAEYKKSGVPFRVKTDVGPDQSGIAANFSVSYEDDATQTEVAVSGSFVESSTVSGLYYSPEVTIPAVGDYTINVVNTTDGLGNVSGAVQVVSATIEDVNSAVAAAQSDITAIKATTDILDTDELNNLAQDISAVDTNLSNLITLVDSQDGSDGITSLRELMNDILAGGANVDSLLNGHLDIQAMIKGDEFLSDGTTSNPLYGKGLDEIFDKLVSNLTDVDSAITAAKNSIETNIANFKTSVEDKVDAVKTVVDANQAILSDATHGNAALKTLIDGLASDIAEANTDTDSIIAILNDATTGLGAIKTLLDTMDGKLDSIEGKIDTLSGNVGMRVFI